MNDKLLRAGPAVLGLLTFVGMCVTARFLSTPLPQEDPRAGRTLDWESVSWFVSRAKTHRGWLVKWKNPNGGVGGLTFVPDPKHEWVLPKEAK